MSSLPPAEAAAPTRVRVAALLLILLGTVLRMRGLDEGVLFIDEAESSINALTILEHGYPTDRYLGLPLFENTLTEPSPEDPEYEFRDTSYSERGMATYHGWLPLYAIAASQRLHGVEPDSPEPVPRVRHGDEDIVRRIRAARLPAVLFGILFLVAIFLCGQALYGADAGLAALTAAALSPKCVWIAQQARYYSAALALGTLAALALWRIVQRGRRPDFVGGAIVLVLLFHTSSLVFAIVLVAGLPWLPRVLRREGAACNLGIALAIGCLGILPWMLWTGYLEGTGRIPMARNLLRFPQDYLLHARQHPLEFLALAGVYCGLICAGLTHARLPPRMAAPLRAALVPGLFLCGWTLAAYFGFQVLVPAASCSLARLSFVLIPPVMLVAAVALASLARMASSRRAAPVAAVACLVAFWARDGLRPIRSSPVESDAVFELVDHLRGMSIPAGTRIYAWPYQHFCLSYYTGLPVQSIAPVRRRFLDEYPGGVLILETMNRLPMPATDWVQEGAARAGVNLDPQQAATWASHLYRRMNVDELARRVATVSPPLPTLAPWAENLLPAARDHIEEVQQGRHDWSLDNPAMFRGSPPLTVAEFWLAFFYRFVGVEERSGSGLNYASRMRNAEACALASTWAVLYSGPRGGS